MIEELRLRKLILQAEQLWKMRFDRAIELAKSFGYNNFAEVIEGIKQETFETKQVDILKPTELHQDIKTLIYDCIKMNGNISVKDICRKLDISYKSFNYNSEKLLSSGRIVRNGRGPATYYTLPSLKVVSA